MRAPNSSRRVVPIIPGAVLQRHRVHEPGDTRYRAAARLMQSLWRERHGYPCGRRTEQAGHNTRLGSRFTAATADAGANFITPEIAELVRWELAYREIAATIDTKRLAGNLLSSQALAFNVFGPLKRSPKLASAVFRRLLPEFVREVEDIWFEHSPGRGQREFTGDNTAFDLLVLCRTVRDTSGFVAIEVKYTENPGSLAGAASPRFDELSERSALFRDPGGAALRSTPVQQFWREHLLAFSMLDAKLYDEGLFLVTAPSQNRECQIAVAKYRQQLAGNNPRLAFGAITVETIVDAMATEGATREAELLRERYFDFAGIDRALFQVIRGGKDERKPDLKAA